MALATVPATGAPTVNASPTLGELFKSIFSGDTAATGSDKLIVTGATVVASMAAGAMIQNIRLGRGWNFIKVT